MENLREIYLDHTATTRPYDAVIAEVARVMGEVYGNPSSLHRAGKRAEDLLTCARQTVAKSLGAREDEIYFNSGGTEGDNTAILGYCAANARRGKTVVTTKIEHPAVLEAFSELEKRGFRAIYLDVDEWGMPDMAQLSEALEQDTILVSMMLVNNETGAILPVEKASAMMDHSKTALHVDAVQAYGKLRFTAKSLGAELISVSGHKIHGPRGIGALYVKKGTRISPLLLGGKQENGLRSGTENLPAIAGFALAARLQKEQMAQDSENVAALKCHLLNTLEQSGVDFCINSPENGSPYLLNLSFPGLKSEVLLHILESNGIYVSAGSACNSKKDRLSHVLLAMGLSKERTDGAVRISIGGDNTKEEIEEVARVLAKEAAALQRIMKR